jgi:hypothetical protein
MSKTATDKAQAAINIVRSRSTETLVTMFELTNEKEITPEVSVTRGWIMDELELREPEAFEKFIDSRQDSPRAFLAL